MWHILLRLALSVQNIIRMILKDTYLKRHESVRETLKVLESKIKRHRNDFMKNPNNWSYLSSLNYIEKALEDINEFLVTN
jgi:hypothetical protein